MNFESKYKNDIHKNVFKCYSDVIMGTMSSQITGLTIIYSIV